MHTQNIRKFDPASPIRAAPRTRARIPVFCAYLCVRQCSLSNLPRSKATGDGHAHAETMPTGFATPRRRCRTELVREHSPRDQNALNPVTPFFVDLSSNSHGLTLDVEKWSAGGGSEGDTSAGGGTDSRCELGVCSALHPSLLYLSQAATCTPPTGIVCSGRGKFEDVMTRWCRLRPTQDAVLSPGLSIAEN